MTTSQFPPEILHDIETTLERASQLKNSPIHVYEEAEKLRQRWEAANIALEDYVETIVKMGGRYSLSYQLDPREAHAAFISTAT